LKISDWVDGIWYGASPQAVIPDVPWDFSLDPAGEPGWALATLSDLPAEQ